MKTRYKILLILAVLLLLLFVVIIFISLSIPTGYEFHSTCNCKLITEGSQNSNYFEIINNSHIKIFQNTSIISKPTLCPYEIQEGVKKRKYSGIKDTEGLLHYKTSCLSLFIEGIFKDKNKSYYLCKCQI